MEEYRNKNNSVFTFSVFSNADDILQEVKSEKFDLVFLDVIMPYRNGIELAKEIRNFNHDIKIIFITSSPDFAVESYTVNAEKYILKPVTKEKIFSILDKVFLIRERMDEGITVKCKTSISRILFSKLEYVEIKNKKLSFYLIDGTVKETYATLLEYEDIILAHKEFVRVHRSFIINMFQIKKIENGEINTYNNQIIPISRYYSSNFKSQYMKHLFLNRGIE